ncbi:hypothetical protein EF847_01475 [Actinobacteria bacterium YIM 96077]|uniref:Uncharacterized protein n=1 Tax=Phytoactinopolyspora halophila TaxID=1981511 RepID=A0A329QFJ4_9ACTN|nr:hypothetical protein [Phytoactinopolyspora halophila]AYY11591.1 hypothetical protein EF847_01475 [Actinobacteria bacterium YIM 96077]RAW11137.1 hypothetical protein DPM12_17500 [Phytoactinopolyspora halophila]
MSYTIEDQIIKIIITHDPWDGNAELVKKIANAVRERVRVQVSDELWLMVDEWNDHHVGVFGEDDPPVYARGVRNGLVLAARAVGND